MQKSFRKRVGKILMSRWKNRRFAASKKGCLSWEYCEAAWQITYKKLENISLT